MTSITRNELAYGCCLLIIAGMFTTALTPVVSSISVVLLTLLALIQPQVGKRFGEFLRNRANLAIAAIFVLHLLSFLQTAPDQRGLYGNLLTLKLPLLLLPLAFGMLPPISWRQYYLCYYLFVVLTAVGALTSLVMYLLDFEHVNKMYLQSHVMETPVNYVRFSLLTGFATIIGAVLYQKRVFVRFAWERKLIAALTIFLFIYLHVLAVRSGLVAFYAVAGLFVAYQVIWEKNFRRALLVSAILLASPLLSFGLLPTFHNKFANTVDDVNRVSATKSANNYSIVGRVYSYKAAFHVFNQHSIAGVGIAAITREIDKAYHHLFPEIEKENRKLPHNQYLYYLVTFGVLGLAVFLICFYYPLLAYFRKADLFLHVHYLIVSISFLFEYTLETQLGVLYAVFFLLLPLYAGRNSADQNAGFSN